MTGSVHKNDNKWVVIKSMFRLICGVLN